ncbi:ESPR-type extended signal peptide-containing protein [Rodentibacter abscessus]|uniref:ESPR-type extended signal peptide-containing protein n=1 Tax=Rodentibacter abscessus TaxID=3381777 RepID=UPI00399D0DB8
MNKIFKVIWNHATQTWVAVSELNRAKGKTRSKTSKLPVLSTIAISIATAGGTVIGGEAFAAATSGSGRWATEGANLAAGADGGYPAKADGSNSIAVGTNTQATGKSSVALGHDAKATQLFCGGT